MIKKNKIINLLLFFVSLTSISQTETPTLSKKELRKNTPAYIGISAGLGPSNFRDFATSPLFYKGTSKYLSLSYLKANSKRESEIGLSYSFGQFHNKFNNHSEFSTVKSVSLFYSRLYQIRKLSSQKLNIKAGGLLSTSGNFRVNEALLNNQIGFELIPTLFGSVKLEKDVSRKKEKNKKFLFIKYKLKPRTKNLAFRLNVGLINSSFRNGYAYSGQSSLLNDPVLFDDYQFKIFSGYRVNSALDYTISLKNKNAIQFSYLWDAYKTGGDLDKFEMANHTLKFTLLFNTNNK
ncbi:hypothetical protein [Aquimarina sp. I32.4]|uniref:hypothetical protein n=1 Tax=Aquimarina sp. I32.4 TaxID=2053903 RepID=UPI0011AF8DA6|nr:hypothetical protein [Aquimarina sp. I32.4]